MEPSSGTPYPFRSAVTGDLSRLRDIERAAGEVFATIGMAAVAADEPPSEAELAEYQESGRCWVAVDRGDVAVAYLIAKAVDGCGHVEQVSVHPDGAGLGIGRRLLDVAGEWAVAKGFPALTLTTFVEVPWNGPYYHRCGFRYLTLEEETPGLRAIRQAEGDAGLDRWPRACMRRQPPCEADAERGR